MSTHVRYSIYTAFQSLPETPKKEESPEPDWKTNIHLRKVRHTPGPVKGIVSMAGRFQE